MDTSNSTAAAFACRIGAIMEYDAIQKEHRVSHLAKACGFSMSTARRLLHGAVPARFETLTKLLRGLDVDADWVLGFPMQRWHPRTMRIYIQCVKGYPPEASDHLMQMMTGFFMEHPRAKNLMNLVEAGKISALTASRLFKT